MRRSTVDLPLHTGKAPRWLFERMVKLSREVILFFSENVGPEEFLKRISNPYWFQAFGCLLGFDWHSSGLTTTVCGAIKEATRGLECGIYVCGGKGKTSRKTPDEILSQSDRVGVDGEKFVWLSKLTAKVDNTALQDGYQLYHHLFIFTREGKWAVVQQGMNQENGYARRYHWYSEKVKDFVNEPQTAICCDRREQLVLNLVAGESEETRRNIVEFSQISPQKLLREFKKIENINLPRRHRILYQDIDPKKVESILLKTFEKPKEKFEEVLLTEGVGPKTLRALALTAELLCGSSVSLRDPARFAFAHGGKDGIPYPVNRKVYDFTIEYFNRVLNNTKIDLSEKRRALQRLRAWGQAR